MSYAIADRVFAILLFLLGLYVAVTAFGMGLWVRGVPGPGFFPILAALLMTGLSARLILRQFSGRALLSGRVPPRILGNTIGFVLALIGFVVLTPLLGIFLSSLLMMPVIGILASDKPALRRPYLVQLGLTCIGTALLCQLLFGIVLDVPLPTGPFGF